MQGTVTDDNGKTYHGRMVYDIDEAYTWEILNGNKSDVEYVIPFEKVVSEEPLSEKVTKVSLRGGEILNLEGTQDVTESNSGILIFTNGEKNDPTYVEWSRVKKIDFE